MPQTSVWLYMHEQNVNASNIQKYASQTWWATLCNARLSVNGAHRTFMSPHSAVYSYKTTLHNIGIKRSFFFLSALRVLFLFLFSRPHIRRLLLLFYHVHFVQCDALYKMFYCCWSYDGTWEIVYAMHFNCAPLKIDRSLRYNKCNGWNSRIAKILFKRQTGYQAVDIPYRKFVWCIQSRKYSRILQLGDQILRTQIHPELVCFVKWSHLSTSLIMPYKQIDFQIDSS